MKKIIGAIVALIILILVVFYYKGVMSHGQENDSVKEVSPDTLSGVIEMRGTIGDGTSMNEMEVINANGDTVYITVPGELINGDINPGDCVDIIYYANEDENLASTVINISSLCHLWSTEINGSNQGLEINDNGSVITYDSNVDYSNWEVKNGFLILKVSKPIGSEKKEEADTFNIMKLTDSQLVLSRDNEETVYELEN